MEEILHQLIGGLSHGLNHPYGDLSDFANIHSMKKNYGTMGKSTIPMA